MDFLFFFLFSFSVPEWSDEGILFAVVVIYLCHICTATNTDTHRERERKWETNIHSGRGREGFCVGMEKCRNSRWMVNSECTLNTQQFASWPVKWRFSWLYGSVRMGIHTWVFTHHFSRTLKTTVAVAIDCTDFPMYIVCLKKSSHTDPSLCFTFFLWASFIWFCWIFFCRLCFRWWKFIKFEIEFCHKILGSIQHKLNLLAHQSTEQNQKHGKNYFHNKIMQSKNQEQNKTKQGQGDNFYINFSLKLEKRRVKSPKIIWKITVTMT